MTQGLRVRRLLPILLIAASIWYIACFLVVASLRATFPLQLEWVEGGVLDSVARVLAHQPVYVAPTHLFVSYLYTPLYYHVGALVCRITGLGFTPLRWLSIACTLGCFLLIFLQTRGLTTSRRAGLLAAGCFAGLYGAAGGSYDLARVDMLFLVLALAAIYAAWRDQAILAGLLFACAYQSKQGAAVIAVCVLSSAWRRPRHCVTGLVTFFAATVGSILIQNHLSGGWYAFYTQWLPSHQPLDPQGLFYFFARDLGRYMVPALLLMAWSVRGDLRKLSHSPRGNFLLFGTLGTSATALAGRFHSGGSANATLPLYAWLAILFGVAVHRQLAVLQQKPTMRAQFASALAALQFLVLFTPPWRFIPSGQQRQQARLFLDQMAAIPGDIYVIDGAADLEPAHKATFANGVTVWDVIRAGDSAAARSLIADLQQSILQRRYSALLSPYALNGQVPGMPANLSHYYRLDVPPLRSGDAARELEMIQTRPIGPAYLFPVRR